MLGCKNNYHYFCIAFERKGALSSAGSERLPYKQRVGGSNPSAPTKEWKLQCQSATSFLLYMEEGFRVCFWKSARFSLTLHKSRMASGGSGRKHEQS